MGENGMTPITQWKRCNSGEWIGTCEGGIECHIHERICRDGESVFITSVTAPWLSPASVLLDNRATLEGAIDGFEAFMDSTAHIETREPL